MSDESGEKSLDPTPSRLASARREGNVPRSQEFGANLAFLGALAATIGVAPLFGGVAREALVRATDGAASFRTILPVLACGLAPLVAASLSGIVASVVQGGGIAIVEVALKFSRLAPAEGLKRMFSAEAIVHGARALVAFFVAMLAVVFALRHAFEAGGSVVPIQTAALAWDGAKHAAFAAAGIGLVFSLAEYGVARKRWLAKLKMSLFELKRELKENDGDPHVRARRKSLHRSMIRSALGKVKHAAFVVVNPTHVAVALDYRPPEVAVPTVLVRASDEAALRVREEANLHRIPIVENIPLARALFAQSSVGDPIPHEQFVAVAEVVAALTREGLLQ